MSGRGAWLAVRIALADLLGETRLAAFSILSIAAMLAPLIILAGLRAGVVEGMRETLLRDPRVRQILSLAHGNFDREFLATLRARPDVVHVSPRLRQNSGSLLLDPGDMARRARAQVMVSDPGDPMLPAGTALEGRAVVLSQPLAARLGVEPGGRITGSVARRACAGDEVLALELTVAAIAGLSSADRDIIFMPTPVAEAIEDWQEARIRREDGDGEACVVVPPAPRQSYAGFRLYAATIEDVPAIVLALREIDIETVSRIQDISPMLAIDRALLRLLAAVAAVAGLGFVLSLTAGLLANVQRKRRLFAALRLMGFRRRTLMLVPMIQAGIVALSGAALATGLALATAAAINAGLIGISIEGALCVITPRLLAFAMGTTVAAALAASALAAWQAAAAEPHEAVSTS